ncbi:MAG: DUF3078 domain-containing protein [Flammeovirgaceae bacterium]
MKQFITTLVVTFSMIFTILGQESAPKTDSIKYWTHKGTFAFTFSQVAFKNWAAGGENSISGVTQLGYNFNYKKDKNSWDNRIDLGYGLIKQGDAKLFKSEDRLEFNSKYGRQISKSWHLAALLGFRTQFAPGYDVKNREVKISDFMAPGYLSPSIGLDYKPNPKFSLYLSPIACRITFVLDDSLANQGAFGVKKAVYNAQGVKIENSENTLFQLGALAKVRYESDIMENVRLSLGTELLSDYLNKPQNVIVNAIVQVNMKVNKYLSANLTVQGIYDDNISLTTVDEKGEVIKDGPRVQWKQVFGAGLSFTF